MPSAAPVSSNAEGARLAADNPAWPRIAGERAGHEYGLHLVAPAIQDDSAQPHPLRRRRAMPQTPPQPRPGP